MSFYQYRKSHCGDKTILRPSYLHNGISYTGKTTSLHWIRAHVLFSRKLNNIWRTRKILTLRSNLGFFVLIVNYLMTWKPQRRKNYWNWCPELLTALLILKDWSSVSLKTLICRLTNAACYLVGCALCPHLSMSTCRTRVKFYIRWTKLHAFFNDQNKGFIDITPDDDDDDPFSKYNRKPSKWTPPYNPDCVDRFIDRRKEEIELVDLKFHRKESNIADSDRQALKTLNDRDDVIIKPADKGGAIVVWKKELYLNEAERQLSDKTFYKRENIDQTLHNRNVVKTTVFEEINANHLPKSASVLVPDEVRCSRFYLLPKIHMTDVPGRPVISACSCPTELLSTYIDDLLKPIVVTLPSYLKDSSHTTRLEQCLCWSDFKGLFIYNGCQIFIPNDQGLVALIHFLNRRSLLSPPTDTIIRIAELVIILNHLEFNGEFKTQVRGVSMGTCMGPWYACLFVYGVPRAAISRTISRAGSRCIQKIHWWLCWLRIYEFLWSGTVYPLFQWL